MKPPPHKKRPRNASGFFDMKSRIWEKTIAPVWFSLWVAEVGVDVLFLGGGNEMVDSGLYFLKWYIFILIVLISYYSINYRGATGKTPKKKHMLVFFRKFDSANVQKSEHPNASWCNPRGPDWMQAKGKDIIYTCIVLHTKACSVQALFSYYWSRLTFSVL